MFFAHGAFHLFFLPQSDASKQLGGYANWTEFTSNCACDDASLSSKSLTPNSEERWGCLNGRVIFRRRATYGSSGALVSNGLDVRPFCGDGFLSNCTLVVTSSVTLSCPFSTAAASDLW